MDPGTMMAIFSALSSAVGGLTGEKGGFGSTYNKNQLSTIDQALNDVRGMRGNNAQDITKNQSYQNGQNWLNDLFTDPNFFDKFEAPLQRQLQESTLPGIANRFGGMGSGGNLNSTAFRNQANRAGTDLMERIAQLRGGMQQQGANQALNYAQQPFQNYMQLLNQALSPTQNTYQGPTMGAMGAFAAPFAQGAANYWGGQSNNQNYMQNQNYANGGY